METLIWTILGYIAMPMIFVFGFAATAALACLLMDLLKLQSLERP